MASNKQKHDHGQRWAIASALIDGSKTLEQISDHFRILARRFGMFYSPVALKEARMGAFLVPNLQAMQKAGWVVFNSSDQTWQLTQTGYREAEKMLAELKKAGSNFKAMMQPQGVSMITFFAHLILSLIKFPAAMLSGSVALLNDALDTAMDALSSVIVYLGIRSDKEQLAGFTLLAFMMTTAGYALWETVSRFITGSVMQPDWLAFIAVAVSAGLSAILWVYQRYTGVAAGSMPIVAQSVDSRNHLLVAGGVGASFLASYLGLPVIDLVVGLAIALMILKGAWDLLMDMIKQKKEGDIDLSAYGFQFFEKHRKRHMIRWFLSEIDRGRIRTREQLEQEAMLSVDFEQIPQLQAFGLADSSGAKKAAFQTAEQLFEEGYIIEDPQDGQLLRLTGKGEKELRHARKRLRPWHTKMMGTT